MVWKKMPVSLSLVLIGDWASRRRGALCSRAFHPDSAPTPAWKKGKKSRCLDTTTERRWPSEERGREKNPDAAGLGGRWRRKKKEWKISFPVESIKKFLRVFFTKSDWLSERRDRRFATGRGRLSRHGVTGGPRGVPVNSKHPFVAVPSMVVKMQPLFPSGRLPLPSFPVTVAGCQKVSGVGSLIS